MCVGNTKPSAFNLLARYPTHHGWLPESLCLKDGKTSRAVSLHLPYGISHSRLPLILKGERGVMTLHWLSTSATILYVKHWLTRETAGREYRASEDGVGWISSEEKMYIRIDNTETTPENQ
nr:hypothetical protein L203_06647 [Cryptococcus depauperatus CBS 7841]